MLAARRLALAGLAVAALSACGGATSPGVTPPEAVVSFTVQPADHAAGVPFDVAVSVSTASGPAAGAPVALALAGGPSGATLGGTTALTTGSAGVATFTGLSITRGGSGYVLVATSGAAHGDSRAFAVTPGAPQAASSALAVSPYAADADGVSTVRVTATVRDAYANPVPGVTVTFAAPGATLSAPSAQADATGQATVTARSGTVGPVTATAGIGGGTRTATLRFARAHADWVTGYWVGYHRDLYPPAAVDFSAMTHLAVGAVLPHADGSLDDGFFLGTGGRSVAADLATRAHAAGRKAILMVGGSGFGDAFRSAASSAHRAAFVSNLAQLARDLGYDGFDLDWEPLAQGDVPDLVALAGDLRAALQPDRIVLTVPVGWVSFNAPGGADDWLAPLSTFDQVNIMSYGMADGWGGWVSWHSAALQGEGGDHPSSVSFSANAYAAPGVAIPREKIGIGLGFYGSCWRGPTAPLQAPGSGVVSSDNDMSYRNIMASYYTQSAYRWDDAAQAGYLSFGSQTGPAGCTFVSYEDPASLEVKGGFVRTYGFGGAIIWTIDQGALAPSGPNPPLSAVKAGFRP